MIMWDIGNISFPFMLQLSAWCSIHSLHDKKYTHVLILFTVPGTSLAVRSQLLHKVSWYCQGSYSGHLLYSNAVVYFLCKMEAFYCLVVCYLLSPGYAHYHHSPLDTLWKEKPQITLGKAVRLSRAVATLILPLIIQPVG